MKTIELIVQVPLESIQSKDYEANIERHCNDNNTCIICGKRIKDINKAKQVQMLTNGNLVSTDQEIEGSQGFFTVGNDCAKKLVLHFTF